jgi:hypothetical protein
VDASPPQGPDEPQLEDKKGTTASKSAANVAFARPPRASFDSSMAPLLRSVGLNADRSCAVELEERTDRARDTLRMGSV